MKNILSRTPKRATSNFHKLPLLASSSAILPTLKLHQRPQKNTQPVHQRTPIDLITHQALISSCPESPTNTKVHKASESLFGLVKSAPGHGARVQISSAEKNKGVRRAAWPIRSPPKSDKRAEGAKSPSFLKRPLDNAATRPGEIMIARPRGLNFYRGFFIAQRVYIHTLEARKGRQEMEWLLRARMKHRGGGEMNFRPFTLQRANSDI